MPKPAGYNHKAPWKGITLKELKFSYPKWVGRNERLCMAYECPIPDCPVLGYKGRGTWCAHVKPDDVDKWDVEADHSSLRTSERWGCGLCCGGFSLLSVHD